MMNDNNATPPMIDWNNLTVIPSVEQVKSVLIFVVPSITSLLVFGGYITTAQATGFLNALLQEAPLIVLVVGGIITLKRTTRPSLQTRATDSGKTIVITDTATAGATTNPNIIDLARAKRTIDAHVADTVTPEEKKT
jgi:hypothetical protein